MISPSRQYQESIVTRLYRDYEVNKILAYIEDEKFIVDLGCGEGITLEKLICKFPERTIIGVDLSPENVNTCNVKGLPAILTSAYSLGFANNCIDCVVLMDVVEHLNYPEKALREIYRVLRSDALLLVLIPNDTAFKIARILTLKIKEAFYDPGHVKRWNPKLIKDELRRHGFKIIGNENLPFFFWPLSLHHLVVARKQVDDFDVSGSTFTISHLD